MSNTRTKKAKMKAQAISVDSDNPDTDNTDQVMNSSKTTTAADDLFGESDEVCHFFLMLIDCFRCLVDGAGCRYGERE